MSDEYLSGAVDAIHLAVEVLEKAEDRNAAEELVERALEYVRRGYSLSEIKRMLNL